MKTSTKKGIRLIVPILLAIILGWYAFSKFPISQVWPYVQKANIGWVIFGVFLGILSHLSRAYRWKYLLEPLGYKVALPNGIMAVFVGYFANFGVPRSGEVLRAAVLANYEEVPFEKGFGTIVAERVADVLVMLGIILVTLILQFDYIFNLLESAFSWKKILIGSISIIILGALFLIYLKKSELALAKKIKGFIKGLKEGVFSIFKMKHKWAFIFHTLFIWGMYILMFYVTTFALPEISQVTIGMILVAFIAASFTIAATNGGVIAYPLAVMTTFSLFGIDETPSYAFGWIMWSSQTLMLVILGIISLVFLPIYNTKKTLV